MKIARSALKHGFTVAQIEHALNNVIDRRLLEHSPSKWLLVGTTREGIPLELIVVMGQNGEQLLIHAMKLRKQFMPGRRRR